MPPKIRSPTPSSSDDEQPQTSRPAPVTLKLNPPTSNSTPALPALPPLPAIPAAAPTSDDELSSLGESEDEQHGDGGAGGSEDESEEEPSEEAEIEEEEEEEDDYSEDDELDELEDEVYNAKATPRQAAMNKSQAAAGSSGVKIKFKLGGAGASAGGSASGSGKATPVGKGGARKAATSKQKSRKRARSYSDSEDDDAESDERQPDELESDSSTQSGARLTFRQRAKELGGENGIQLESLPNQIVTKGPKLTAAEVELRRQEISRKRKSQSDARLEEEKTETINRLLNKNAQKRGPGGRLRKPTGLNVSGARSDDEGGPQVPEAPVVVEVIPTMSRWISSTKSGQFEMKWMTPLVGEWPVVEAAKAAPTYPGPRPPPKTRRFDAMVVG